MPISQLGINTECEVFGKMHKIVSINPPYIWLKKPDGESVKFEYLALITHPTFKAHSSLISKKSEVISYENALAKLNEVRRNEVSKRFEIIQPILLLENIKGGDLQSMYFFKDKYEILLKDGEQVIELNQKDLIPRIIKHYGGSRATVMRLLQRYRADGLEGAHDNTISNREYILGGRTVKSNNLVTANA